jgi:hypothetical protein
MSNRKPKVVTGNLEITPDNIELYRDLRKVGGHLHIKDVNNIEFTQLEEIGSELGDGGRNNTFPALEKIGGDVECVGKISFPSLKEIGGKLNLTIKNACFPALERIFGGLECDGEGADFPSLLSVAKFTEITCSGARFPVLETVSNMLWVSAGNITLPALKAVGGRMVVDFPAENFNCPQLNIIGGYLLVNAPALNLPKLTIICGELKNGIGGAKRLRLPKLRSLNGESCRPVTWGEDLVVPMADANTLFGLSLTF